MASLSGVANGSAESYATADCIASSSWSSAGWNESVSRTSDVRTWSAGDGVIAMAPAPIRATVAAIHRARIAPPSAVP
jgi:hypothetical protein